MRSVRCPRCSLNPELQGRRGREPVWRGGGAAFMQFHAFRGLIHFIGCSEELRLGQRGPGGASPRRPSVRKGIPPGRLFLIYSVVNVSGRDGSTLQPGSSFFPHTTKNSIGTARARFNSLRGSPEKFFRPRSVHERIILWPCRVSAPVLGQGFHRLFLHLFFFPAAFSFHFVTTFFSFALIQYTIPETA